MSRLERPVGGDSGLANGHEDIVVNGNGHGVMNGTNTNMVNGNGHINGNGQTVLNEKSPPTYQIASNAEKSTYGNGTVTGAGNVGGISAPIPEHDVHRKRIGRLAALPIEELVYYANGQRISYGMHSNAPGAPKTPWFKFFENDFGPVDDPANPLIVRKDLGIEGSATSGQELAMTPGELDPMAQFEKDVADARRSLRTASWAMMFFLITTDVIGPFNAPFAISTMGWAGGICLSVFYSSFLVLNLYLRLDSDRHPIHSFGELVEVFFGVWGHYGTSFIQVVQIIFIVGSNCIANAQSMTQLTAPNGTLCFVASIVIWAVIGLIISIPFRSLSKLSYVASFNVFINILIIFMSMGFVAHSAPNFQAAAAAYGFTPPFGPAVTTAVGSGDLATQVNGAMNAVFAWSGLMIFVEFLNEMRRPHEFAKSFTCAEVFILVLYLMYGCYVYAFQGQYTLPVAFQGVSNYTWQSIGNGLSLWTYTMASVTYLNIAVKVIYWFFFEQLFVGPPLMSKMGFVYWTILQICSWAISFIIGTAIPQVQTIQALIGAACLLQFTYTFPPLMQLAFDIQADASKMDGVFVPGSGPGAGPRRIDTWRHWSRWQRGLFTGRVWFKWVNFVYLLAALATCGLGVWGSVETIISTFKNSAATSFGCAAPV